jgi:hypothetical protein
MEYLMSYGWAILVIMIIGVVLWQMGVFNLHPSASYTESGFTALKPILASCGISDGSLGGATPNRGLVCVFANVAGGQIFIQDVTVSVLPGSGMPTGSVAGPIQCGYSAVRSNSGRVVRYVGTNPECKETPTAGYGGGEVDCVDHTGDGIPDLPVTGEFRVMGGGLDTPGLRNCFNLDEAERASVQIDIDYFIQIGNVRTFRESSGRINIV